MTTVSALEVSRLLGVDRGTVLTWLRSGAPTARRGARGDAHEIDLGALVAWRIERAVERERERGERQLEEQRLEYEKQRAMPRAERLLAARGVFSEIMRMSGSGPLLTCSGEEFATDLMPWADLLEFVSWGAPFVEAGSIEDPSAWRFCPAQFVRWLALMTGALQDLGLDAGGANPIASIARELRKLRGEEALREPGGFEAEPLP